MIEFKPITLEDKKPFENYLLDGKERGCEYSFANLYLWGRQKAAILHDHLVLFSQYNRRSVYPFPVGFGDKKAVLDTIIADSKARGIPCRITGVNETEKRMFRFHFDLDSSDYVYSINDLADLKGKKYQRKRNHYNRFRDSFPEYTVESLNENNVSRAKEMVDMWYKNRLLENPGGDYHMERAALEKAFRHFRDLDMESLVLLNDEDVLAITFGSRLSPNTFDVHFEKAHWDISSAYSAINCEFAKYIRNKHPDIQFLNREEDLGLEGLRKAKQRYYPHHMVEKYWACLLEDDYEY